MSHSVWMGCYSHRRRKMERAVENQEQAEGQATAEAVGHLGLGSAARWICQEH